MSRPKLGTNKTGNQIVKLRKCQSLTIMLGLTCPPYSAFLLEDSTFKYTPSYDEAKISSLSSIKNYDNLFEYDSIVLPHSQISDLFLIALIYTLILV